MNKKLKFFKKTRSSYNISKNLFFSFKYAFNGIYYCFQSTRNFRIQLFFAVIIFLLAFIFNLKFYEHIIIFSTVISVLIFELINTSIESLVDLTVETKFNKLAKIAKDCSAGAVLLVDLNSIFVAGFIFIPKIKLLIQTL